MKGLFITFEGIDGCGKSSHLLALARELQSRVIEPVITREPGGTRTGEQIRELVLSKSSAGLNPSAELMLYAADRAEHVASVIKPALEAGRIVLSDRYADSTVAFQGYGRQLDLRMIESLNQMATSGIAPDLTILLDVEPAVARARLSARQVKHSTSGGTDRLDDEHYEFHVRVREGYLKIAAQHPDRIHVIDSSGPVEEVRKQVFGLALPLIESRTK